MEKETHFPNWGYVSFWGHFGWHQTWWRCCTRTWGHRGCVAWPSGEEKPIGILRYLRPLGLSRWWFQIFVDPISRWHISMRGEKGSLLNHPTIHILNSLGAQMGCSILYVLWLLWLGIFWAGPPSMSTSFGRTRWTKFPEESDIAKWCGFARDQLGGSNQLGASDELSETTLAANPFVRPILRGWK